MGSQLKKYRDRSGKSQEDIANLIGVTRSAYNQYENDVRKPDYDTLVKLARIFHATTDQLLEYNSGSSDHPSAESEGQKYDTDRDNIPSTISQSGDKIDNLPMEKLERDAKNIVTEKQLMEAIKQLTDAQRRTLFAFLNSMQPQKKEIEIEIDGEMIQEIAAHLEGEYGTYDPVFAEHVLTEMKHALSEYDRTVGGKSRNLKR